MPLHRKQRPCWFKKKPRELAKFLRVQPSRFLVEFRGTLRQTPYAIHHFYCFKLDPTREIEFLHEGTSPSHLLYCVCYLFRSPKQPRIVFQAPITVLSDSTASLIAQDLAKGISKADRVFLVRCRDRREFPWCVSGEAFDQFWEMEIGTWVRLRRKKDLKGWDF